MPLRTSAGMRRTARDDGRSGPGPGDDGTQRPGLRGTGGGFALGGAAERHRRLAGPGRGLHRVRRAASGAARRWRAAVPGSCVPGQPPRADAGARRGGRRDGEGPARRPLAGPHSGGHAGDAAAGARRGRHGVPQSARHPCNRGRCRAGAPRPDRGVQGAARADAGGRGRLAGRAPRRRDGGPRRTTPGRGPGRRAWTTCSLAGHSPGGSATRRPRARSGSGSPRGPASPRAGGRPRRSPPGGPVPRTWRSRRRAGRSARSTRTTCAARRRGITWRPPPPCRARSPTPAAPSRRTCGSATRTSTGGRRTRRRRCSARRSSGPGRRTSAPSARSGSRSGRSCGRRWPPWATRPTTRLPRGRTRGWPLGRRVRRSGSAATSRSSPPGSSSARRPASGR